LCEKKWTEYATHIFPHCGKQPRFKRALHQHSRSQFGPTIAEIHTYSRGMILNKRSTLTLWRIEISMSSDRTIFITRLDSALSSNRYHRRWLCRATQCTSMHVLWSTDVPQANDLDMRGTILTNCPETWMRSSYRWRRSHCRHCSRLFGNFATASRRRSDSCPKHLEERLRTSAPSQLNDNG